MGKPRQPGGKFAFRPFQSGGDPAGQTLSGPVILQKAAYDEGRTRFLRQQLLQLSSVPPGRARQPLRSQRPVTVTQSTHGGKSADVTGIEPVLQGGKSQQPGQPAGAEPAGKGDLPRGFQLSPGNVRQHLPQRQREGISRIEQGMQGSGDDRKRQTVLIGGLGEPGFQRLSGRSPVNGTERAAARQGGDHVVRQFYGVGGRKSAQHHRPCVLHSTAPDSGEPSDCGFPRQQKHPDASRGAQ